MGAEVAVWDDRPTPREAAAPLLGATAADDFAASTALVLSPGIPHRLPAPHPAAAAARAAGMPILSDAELLYQAQCARRGSAARFVGITGTNGKSTTTALLHHILVSTGRRDRRRGGNLGTAALALPLCGTPASTCWRCRPTCWSA